MLNVLLNKTWKFLIVQDVIPPVAMCSILRYSGFRKLKVGFSKISYYCWLEKKWFHPRPLKFLGFLNSTYLTNSGSWAYSLTSRPYFLVCSGGTLSSSPPATAWIGIPAYWVGIIKNKKKSVVDNDDAHEDRSPGCALPNWKHVGHCWTRQWTIPAPK